MANAFEYEGSGFDFSFGYFFFLCYLSLNFYFFIDCCVCDNRPVEIIESQKRPLFTNFFCLNLLNC